MKLFPARFPWHQAALTLALWSVGVLALGGEALSPEERLAAIRKGLVQAALDGPTQVQATQWIDGKGALQESSSFRAGMEVRGVRVLGYSADAQGDPLAKLQWINADTPKTPASALGKGQCKGARPGNLRHVVGWTWANDGTVDADTAPLLASLQADAAAQLAQSAGASTEPSAGLHWVPRPRQSARSSYEQALLGSSLDTTPWRLELQAKLVTVPSPVVIAAAQSAFKNRSAVDTEASPPAEPQGMAVQLRMALTGRQQNKAVLQSEASVPLKLADDNWGAPSLSANTRDQIAGQMQRWRADIERYLGCLTVVADVVQAGGAQMRINVGSAAGLQVGDEWVVASDHSAVQRALEPGVLEQTVLAQVQSVGAYYAELRAVAGNPQNVKPNWTAWSANASR